MRVNHGFGLRSHDLVGLFDKTNKVSTFMNKLEKQSLIDPTRYDSNKYKGDTCEIINDLFDPSNGIAYYPIDKGWKVKMELLEYKAIG